MRYRRNWIDLFIGIAVVLALVFWSFSYPETTFRHNLKPFYVYGSQLAGLTGFVLFAFSLILSTRWHGLESRFGGLDKMYHKHHDLGKLAFFFLLAHGLLLALRWIPEEIDKSLWYLFPVHRKVEINLGSYAFWGLVLLIGLTLWIKMPYDKWKISHKFMGAVFVLALFHLYFLDDFITQNLPLSLYLGGISLLALFAYLYKTVLSPWTIRTHPYEVVRVNHLNERVIEIHLNPLDEPISFVPGQFCFFSFKGETISGESHPFTLCSSPGTDGISIIVKVLGDYTEHLYRSLRAGHRAKIEGPYGRFDYKRGSSAQIWIGGGVGIAPFFSWARDLKRSPQEGFEADLYYCFDAQTDAVHVEEFEAMEKENAGFRLQLICREEKGLLQTKEIEGIKERDIFICGPKEMRKSILSDLRQMGVAAHKVHYEDFDFI